MTSPHRNRRTRPPSSWQADGLSAVMAIHGWF
jgi:hypothetical protein